MFAMHLDVYAVSGTRLYHIKMFLFVAVDGSHH